MEPDNDKTLFPSGLSGFPSRDADRLEHASTHVLPMGTRLGEFEIVDLIGEGGFGIVYLAFDHSLERQVAIKEYMPSGLALRTRAMHVAVTSQLHAETFNTGMRSFINEARLLARFDSPSLVKVFRFWEANGTAYMAMPFYDGITLKQALANGSIVPTEEWIRAFLANLFDAVDMIHAVQCYHRDIAPDNILLLRDGRPLLLDFGAARRVITDRTQGPTAILKPGFAPIEQYADIPTLKQGPWTDVYALAAVVYYLITGRAPSPAVSRIMHDDVVPASVAGRGRYSPAFLGALDRGLAVKPEHRIRSVAEFRDALGIDENVPKTMPPGPGTTARPASQEGGEAPVREAGAAGPTGPTGPVGPTGSGGCPPLRPPAGNWPGALADAPVTLRRSWASLDRDKRRLAWALAAIVLVGGIGGGAYSHFKKEASPPEIAEPAVAGPDQAPAEPNPAPPPSPDRQAAGDPGAPARKQGPDIAGPVYPSPGTPPAPASVPVPVPVPVPAPVPAPSAEETAWDRAAALNSEDDYAAYLRSFPKGSHAPAARERLAQLRMLAEDELWRHVSDMNETAGYESYLNKYPKGRYASAARTRISSLRQAQEQRNGAPPGAEGKVAGTTPRPGTDRPKDYAESPSAPASPSPEDAARPRPNPGAGAASQEEKPPAREAPSETKPVYADKPQPRPQPAPPEPDKPAVATGKTYRLSDQTYIGDFSSDPVTGLVSGKGRVRWDNGDQFDGTLVRGVKEGRGEFLWASGQRYRGEWSRGLPNGKGSMKFPNGDEYVGEMRDGVPNGAGTINFANGNRYTGSVKDGLPDGKGSYRYGTGDLYAGQWSKGKSHGFGRYTWASGDYWEGEFRDDKQTENGKLVRRGSEAASAATQSGSESDSKDQPALLRQ